MAKGIKTGGRQAGTCNKVTTDLRQILKDIVAKGLNNLEKDIDQLEAKDRIELLTKLLPYTIPKFENVTQEPSDNSLKGNDVYSQIMALQKPQSNHL